MTPSRTNKIGKKLAGFDLTPYVIALGIMAVIATFYIGYRASISSRTLFSVQLLALFAGLLFETFRVSKNWKPVLYTFVASYFISLLSILPSKGENNYIFENHIESWPYFFIFFYACTFAYFHKDKISIKLTEGITLLLSISLVYWTIDYGFTNYRNWIVYILLAISILLTAFAVVNALTDLHLTRKTRLTLSIWSTVIMFAFALDNTYRVFKNPEIESTHLTTGIYIGLQFFLLGVSAIYIMQNYLLLSALIPSKSEHNQRELKESKKDLINRYSDKQVSTAHSLFCIAFTVTCYGLNYQYQVLPRHTMIWFVFITFPLLLRLIDFSKTLRNNFN